MRARVSIGTRGCLEREDTKGTKNAKGVLDAARGRAMSSPFLRVLLISLARSISHDDLRVLRVTSRLRVPNLFAPGAIIMTHPFEPLSYAVWGACIEVQRQLSRVPARELR